jgi:adenine deaminase
MTAPPIKIRQHYRLRAIERYGVDLTLEDKEEITRIILQGGSILTKNSEETCRETHEMFFKNKFWIIVIARYGPRIGIVTVLPVDRKHFVGMKKRKKKKKKGYTGNSRPK